MCNLSNISLAKLASANASSVIWLEILTIGIISDWTVKVKLLFLEGFVEKNYISPGDLVSFVLAPFLFGTMVVSLALNVL